MSILEMSLQASMMIVVIIIARALAVNRLPKWGFQVLWGIVAARLLVPVRAEFHLSAYNAVPEFGRTLPLAAAPLTAASASVPLAAAVPSAPAHTAVSTMVPALHISPWLIVWAAGAVLLFAYFVLAHHRWRKVCAGARVLFTARAGASRGSRRISVKASNRVDAPLTYGVLFPAVLVPEDLVDRPEYEYALTHELIHVRHWDALKKWLLMIALCAHWFNPLVWAMYILANRDIELYCDEALLRAQGGGQRARYASMLLDLEEARCIPAPLVSHFGRNAIEERIVAIMRYKKTSALGIILALALVAFTTAALATSSVSPAPAADSAATHLAGESGDIDLPENPELFAPYARFGLTYDEEKDRLYYDGQLVRYFEDSSYPFDKTGHNRGMINCVNEFGTVDAHAVWDASRRFGSGEAFDPWQGLTGVEAYTRQEFDARTADLEKGRYSVSAQEAYAALVPAEDQEPHAVPAPSEDQEPHAALIPSEDQEPHAVPAPSEDQEPHAVPAPSEDQEPHAALVPAEDQEPHAALVPAEDQEPHAVPAPAEEQEPHAVPTPSEDQEPYAVPAPSEDPEPHAALVPSEDQEPHAVPALSEDQEPRAALVPSEDQEPNAAPVLSEDQDPYAAPVLSEDQEPYAVPVPSEDQEPYATPALEEAPAPAAAAPVEDALSEYSRKAWKMDYENLLLSGRQWYGEVFLCKGPVVEILQDQTPLIVMNVGAEDAPQYVVLDNASSMANPSVGVTYTAYADVAGSGNYFYDGEYCPRLTARYILTPEDAWDDQTAAPEN
jgi:beta-lactamase regulating signal transducer with metallopeptidase domain